MTKPRIVVDENPAPELRDAVQQPLRAFNDSKVGPMNVANLAILLEDPQTGVAVGGLWGRSGGNWLFVELLVVPEALRGQGMGTSLMRQAETIARKRGCIGVWLDTFTFQAQGFYEKLGYEVFGRIDNYPGNHARLFLHKRLDPIRASS